MFAPLRRGGIDKLYNFLTLVSTFIGQQYKTGEEQYSRMKSLTLIHFTEDRLTHARGPVHATVTYMGLRDMNGLILIQRPLATKGKFEHNCCALQLLEENMRKSLFRLSIYPLQTDYTYTHFPLTYQIHLFVQFTF